jgi:hypothetical protein
LNPEPAEKESPDIPRSYLDLHVSLRIRAALRTLRKFRRPSIGRLTGTMPSQAAAQTGAVDPSKHFSRCWSSHCVAGVRVDEVMRIAGPDAIQPERDAAPDPPSAWL